MSETPDTPVAEQVVEPVEPIAEKRPDEGLHGNADY